MKKAKLWLSLALSATLAVSAGGCAKEKTAPDWELPYYGGERTDVVSGKMEFNETLFYRNDKFGDGADPFVLDNTARDDYYYLYVTGNSFLIYRSKDLVNWETVGNALNNTETGSEARKVVASTDWAPEVVYDDGTYYLFFSGTPQTDKSVRYQMYVATSDRPTGGFELVNFLDEESCGAGNLHVYDTETYGDYWAKYLLLNPASYNAFCETIGGVYGRSDGYSRAIDPHPYVDPQTGKKYLFAVDNGGDNRLWGVEMENWLKPKWDTAKLICVPMYYTIADWQTVQDDPVADVETVSYENNNTITEGPAMLYRNGKYYLTFSINDYKNSSYSVAQAVADAPLGDFRKLRAEENGLLLSSSAAGIEEVSGSGHHSFVTIGDKQYVVYHRHNDPAGGGDPRNPATDEVKWVRIKDKDGADLDVMYVNGPTASIQPLPEGLANNPYRNIAPEATVSGAVAAGSDKAYLTDGLLSVVKNETDFIETYVRETLIDQTTTFTFDFSEARTVRAVMVYNSKNDSDIFRNISRIELVCVVDGQSVTKVIKDVAFSKEFYQVSDYGDYVMYVMPGACAFAEFNEQTVTSVRITVEKPAEQTQVGLSEIRILGK